MADILEKKKGKKIVSFKFTACLGRDKNGKRICKCIDGFHSASCILPQYR